ncbi:MAG: S-adenosylmethionine:tRNA ribosyltransferase-isomerase, partial [Flavisolibacter sp.]
ERIAEFPLSNRADSKLLVYENGSIQDDRFFNLSHHIQPGSTLIFNNTRVIEARLIFKKPTGASIEIFILEPFNQSIEQSLQQRQQVSWLCLIGGASKWKPGQLLHKKISTKEGIVELTARYVDRANDAFIIEFTWGSQQETFSEVLHAAGAIPLPPYIKRAPDTSDKDRYQTVFSKHEGSVAAPTAALHFTPEVFDALASKNIMVEFLTLHVGAGTFKPVKSETISGHQMHEEPFTVSKSTLENIVRSEKVIAVGTTSLRTIESLYWIGIKLKNGVTGNGIKLGQWEAYHLAEKNRDVPYAESFGAIVEWMEREETTELHSATSLIIVPGYKFKVPSGIITNFHQPKSTLLLLISAFIGAE